MNKLFFYISLVVIACSCNNTEPAKEFPEINVVKETKTDDGQKAIDRKNEIYKDAGSIMNASKQHKHARLYTDSCTIYKNQAYGFHIAVPPKWKLKENIDSSIPAAFYNTDLKNSYRFTDYIRIAVEPTDYKNADEWLEKNLYRYEGSLKNYTEIRKGSIVLMDGRIPRIHYTFTQGNIPVEVLSYFFVKNGHAIIVSGHAHQRNFKAMFPIFTEYIGSIEKL